MPVPRRGASLRNNLLDPQLGPKIKREPNSRPSTPGLLPSYDIMDGTRGYAAATNGWRPMPYGPSPSHITTSNSYASDADDDEDDDDDTSTYGYPRPRIPCKRKMSEENISWPGSMAGSLHGSAYFGEEQDPLDPPNDMARLKGDIWPGMDIFDSATPEMRRKRNQKKAFSVIVQLQATSEIVTPTELIFDHAGEFKKERVISGEPNSADSPLRGETTPEPDEPPVKKRATTRRRPKTVLAERDPNGGRNLRSNRRNGAHHPSFGKARSHYIDGSDDFDEDDGLTYGRHRPAQRRSGLSIHRDNTGPDITFDRPASMNYLTASFPEPLSSTHTESKSTQSGYGRTVNQLGNGGYYAPLPQPYRPQQRPSSAGFRAADNQSNVARDLSAFGAFTNQPLFPVAQDLNNSLLGAGGFLNMQQQYSTGTHIPPVTQSFTNDSTLEMHNWDVFGLNNDAAFGTLDINFGNANDTNGANPLFFEGTTGLPGDDDEGTVSAPLSDH